jgi:hypothetical protein
MVNTRLILGLVFAVLLITSYSCRSSEKTTKEELAQIARDHYLEVLQQQESLKYTQDNLTTISINNKEFLYLPAYLNSTLADAADRQLSWGTLYDDEKIVELMIQGYSEEGFDYSDKYGWHCEFGDNDDYLLYYIWNNETSYAVWQEHRYPDTETDTANNTHCRHINRFAVPIGAELVGATDGWNVILYEKEQGALKKLLEADSEKPEEPELTTPQEEYFYDCIFELDNKNITLRSEHNRLASECSDNAKLIEEYEGRHVEIMYIGGMKTIQYTFD